MNNDSILKTFGVAAALCVVCAVIVSVADVSLKGMQQRNKALDKQINILRAAGLVEPKAKVDAKQAAKLFENAKAVVVDLETGKIVEEKPAAEADGLTLDPKDVVEIKKEYDVAKIKYVPKKEIAYLFNDENGALQTVALPIKGTGLWSTMYGFIALNGDLKTVAHIVFYDHGETPGLGGEISNPNWTAKWEGKQALGDGGGPIIRVVKGIAGISSDGPNCEVDGISGATLTCNGVNATVSFWLGERGFGPFLANLKNGTAYNVKASEN